MSISWGSSDIPAVGDSVVKVERSRDGCVVWVHYASGKCLSSSIRDVPPGDEVVRVEFRAAVRWVRG